MIIKIKHVKNTGQMIRKFTRGGRAKGANCQVGANNCAWGACPFCPIAIVRPCLVIRPAELFFWFVKKQVLVISNLNLQKLISMLFREGVQATAIIKSSQPQITSQNQIGALHFTQMLRSRTFYIFLEFLSFFKASIRLRIKYFLCFWTLWCMFFTTTQC